MDFLLAVERHLFFTSKDGFQGSAPKSPSETSCVEARQIGVTRVEHLYSDAASWVTVLRTERAAARPALRPEKKQSAIARPLR